MTTTRTRTASPPAALSLDARLAATGADMTVRMEMALLQLGVDSAHAEQPARLVDVISTPAAGSESGGEGVAALLRRAQQRVLRPNGWSRDTGTNRHGGMCLEYAIQAEAHNPRDEQEARILLRRATGSGDPLPHINRHLTGAGHAGQLLGTAAALAATHNL